MPKDNYHLTIRPRGRLSLSRHIEVWGSSAQEVVDMMEAVGCEVLSITKPGKKCLWNFDKSEIEKACELLKIEWPIRLTRGTSRAHRGTHTLKVKTNYTKPKHFVAVTKTLSIKKANKVIWHELAHAAQSERAADNAPASASAAALADYWKHHPSRKGGYATRACEDEALSYEQCADYWMLLRENCHTVN